MIVKTNPGKQHPYRSLEDLFSGFWCSLAVEVYAEDKKNEVKLSLLTEYKHLLLNSYVTFFIALFKCS